MTVWLPQGYRWLTRPGVKAFAWAGAVEWLEAALESEGTLEAWALAGDSVALGGGRGGARARPAPVPGPDGRSSWACRHYRRGGWVAPIVRDRYTSLGRERPLRELVASTHARARGIRTPAVVAGAVYRAGPWSPMYRADLVTELVPDVASLGDWLRRGPSEFERAALLRSAGDAVRTLEDARVLHADLSAGNVLLPERGPAWVIDLDRCRILAESAPAPAGRMRRRIERSLGEVAQRKGVTLSGADWEALRAGFEGRA